MIETYETDELMNAVLDAAGETLSFSFGNILGIPGNRVILAPGSQTPYDVEVNEVNFKVKYSDIRAHNITEGSLFTFLSRNIRYTFKILSCTNDLTGWADIKVALIEVINV